MAQQHIAILTHAVVLAELKRAWQDSRPGIRGGHEEGGFILQDAAGNISVARWPKGAQDTIIVPPRPNCRIGGKDILASLYASEYRERLSPRAKRNKQARGPR